MKSKKISSNPRTIRKVMESAGTRFGSVEFRKRSDGTHRLMCFRLGVRNPAHVAAPRGGSNRRAVDFRNTQVTVYDTNKPVFGYGGVQIGRGDYRVIPLENVTRLTVDGVRYCVAGR